MRARLTELAWKLTAARRASPNTTRPGWLKLFGAGKYQKQGPTQTNKTE